MDSGSWFYACMYTIYTKSKTKKQASISSMIMEVERVLLNGAANCGFAVLYKGAGVGFEGRNPRYTTALRARARARAKDELQFVFVFVFFGVGVGIVLLGLCLCIPMEHEGYTVGYGHYKTQTANMAAYWPP